MLIQMRTPVAKAVTFVLFSLLILSFAVWGIGDIFRGAGQSAAVAEVGDIKIEQNDFARALTREISRVQASFGGRLEMEDARALGLVDQVLQQMVIRALFENKADELGMIVTEEQIKQQIAGEKAFRDELGNFDRNRFEQVLRASGMSEGQFIETLGKDIKRQQIVEAVSGARRVPDTLAKTLLVYASERRTAEAIFVSDDSVAAPAEPDEATLRKLHEENAGNFMAPETRSLTLIQLLADDLAREIAVAEDDVRAEYDARLDDLTVPERRAVEQVVLDSEEQAKEVKTAVDGGQSFAEAAQAIAGKAPLSLGALSQSELEDQLPDIAETVFASEADAVVGPVQSPFGWHLAHVVEIQPGSVPSFEATRDDLTHELAMREAVDSLISIANQLDDELGAGAKLEEAAATLGLTPITVPAVDREGRDAAGQPIETIAKLDDALGLAFDLQVGEDSLLTETEDGDYVIVRVDAIQPEAARPFEAVRDQVLALWQTQERDRLAREKAEALAARAAEGVELSKIAEDEGLAMTLQGPVTRFGRAEGGNVGPALTAKLFELSHGDVATARGDGGTFVVKLIDIVKAEPGTEPEALKQMRDNLAERMAADLLSAFSESLRLDSPVSVNPRLIDDVVSRF